MKRLLILLMLVSQPVWAEWVRLGQANTGAPDSFTHYLDPATVRKTSNGRRAWTMTSFEKPQTFFGKTYLSMQQHLEFDCVGERVRSLQTALNASKTGDGKLVESSNEPTSWNVSPPGSVYETQLKAVCRMPLK